MALRRQQRRLRRLRLRLQRQLHRGHRPVGVVVGAAVVGAGVVERAVGGAKREVCEAWMAGRWVPDTEVAGDADPAAAGCAR